MQEGLSAAVPGPSAILPRGYLWLAPVWYAGAVALIAAAGWLPLWFRLSADAGLLIAMLTFVCVLGTCSIRAFRADASGVRIGLPPSTRRRGNERRRARELTWRQIERVRISPRRDGAVVELILSSHASWAVRGHEYSPLRRAWRMVLLLIPFWYLLRPTGVASPLAGPARYRIPLRGMTSDELGQSMRLLAPADVGVAVLVRRR